ncbi:hypothetical protein B0T16DRAFT_317309 [Cercophora newfieldiana]|uniref:HNH nuclease domain-containing protein n=1 Tax=Cercophora newfieldiana TaxID=92897 RepID=A0AA39YMQ1_9PEZI|nr:hypothetical protein B0T16DRAFT_317309 [Cercophora newfieldiana]
MAAPSSHRHQSSLETAEPLFANEQQRTQAVGRFRRILNYFEAAEQQASSDDDGYNRPVLIRLTFEYARSQKSQDKFLGAFFRSLAVGMLDDDDSVDLSDDSDVADFRSSLFGFADHLITYFFLPLRAATNKTPQPSPVYHAAVQQAQTQEEQQRIQDFVGTPERLSTLRGLCLTRDRHRCVVTRAYDFTEANNRLRHPPAMDDDGNPLDNSNQYGGLEVAHILPYALTKQLDGELDESRKAAIAILNMFDVGVVYLIKGTDIDRPRNAITLGLEMHRRFGQFEIFFEPVAGAPPHTYRINGFSPLLSQFPITRTLFIHPSIDPPAERLLALHSAIAHILHLSGAGDYIERILRDMEEGGVVKEDGSTQLGVLVNLALRMRG